MKFNKTKIKNSSNRKRNFEGEVAYKPDSPELGLVKVTINNLLEDSYYETDAESVDKVEKRFAKAADKKPEFPLKLASYARQEMYLRDISQLLLVLSAQHEDSKMYVEEWAPEIIRRADEPCTVVAMHDKLVGGTLPKPLKKGINKSLHNFDKYQFDKYDNTNREVNIRDVINRTHPNPQDELREEIFERLMKGDLDDYPEVEPLDESQGKTWETVISEKGNTAEAWREVIDDMGLFALIRNIRNMKEAGLDSEEIVKHMDTDWVKSSKIYPFRFYQSYNAVKQAGVSDQVIEKKLSEAIDVAADSLDDSLTSTFTAVDTSGSMYFPLSDRSTLDMVEIGCLFGAMMMRNGSDAGVFSKVYREVNAHFNTPTLELKEKLENTRCGASTNGHLAIRDIREKDRIYDRVVIFTDCQLWNSTGFSVSRRSSSQLRDEWEKYKEEVNPDASLYIIDLNSYGDLNFPENYPDVYNISGWSSKILDFIQYAEDEKEIVKEIKERTV